MPTTHLEEKIAYLEHEMRSLSDEMYQQQREINNLKECMELMREQLRSHGGQDSIIRPASEEAPPPHY